MWGSYHLNVSSQSSLQRFGILTSCYKILSSHPQKCSRSIFILTLNFSVFPKPPSNVTVQSIQNWLKSASKQVEVKHKCCKFPHPQSQFILILPVFISSYLSVSYPQSSYLRNLNPLSSEKAGMTPMLN